MLTSEVIRSLLPILIALPLLATAVLPFLKQGAARRFAIQAALAHLILTALIVASAVPILKDRKAVEPRSPHWESEKDRIFEPEFVPGDPGREVSDQSGNKHRVPSHTTTWNLVTLNNTQDPSSSEGETILRPVQFFIGLDGLNIWLIALSSLMMVPVVLISLNTIKERINTYFAWLFALQALVIAVFLAFDILLFYICFELTLVPLFFLISIWGIGSNKREAARKLFLFTLAGGLITLLGIAGVVMLVYNTPVHVGASEQRLLSFSIPELSEFIHRQLEQGTPDVKKHLKEVQVYLFLALTVGFAVKIPLVPLHSWLPGAYAEVPIGVTVMLSSLLAKMGTFGLLRICLPMAPDATLGIGMSVLGTLACSASFMAASAPMGSLISRS